MGGCAAKLRKAIEDKDTGEKPQPVAEPEELFKERVKEIVGEDENENESEIQGCKQRPSLSLLFKQEEAKEWTESEKLKNDKQEPILEAPTRPKEEAEPPSLSQQTKSQDLA